jgi:hypothetical protein
MKVAGFSSQTVTADGFGGLAEQLAIHAETRAQPPPPARQ